ncbi:MAG: hypothetical protein LBL38_03475 [Lactobacillales bacterium]|jgi:hypothetical protein|nr:hypothetical protein [Lactobacillales bacterium]
MKSIERKILFIMMLFVYSISFTKTVVHGMDDNLQQSLFLPTNHWLHTKVAEKLENKTYSISNMRADIDHIIILKSNSGDNSTNRIIIHVLLKLENSTSYEDCIEENDGGYVSLFVNFKKPQKGELNEDEFSGISESATTFGYNQSIIDKKVDDALTNDENEAYRWINYGGAKRELFALNFNGLGYMISKDGEQTVFFNLRYCIDLGIPQYTFLPWEKVQEKLDRAQRQRNFKAGEAGRSKFDLSKIKFGSKSST